MQIVFKAIILRTDHLYRGQATRSRCWAVSRGTQTVRSGLEEDKPAKGIEKDCSLLHV